MGEYADDLIEAGMMEEFPFGPPRNWSTNKRKKATEGQGEQGDFFPPDFDDEQMF